MTGRDEDIDAMSEDKLLALPEANVTPRDLPKLHSIHAIAVQRRNADELVRELTGASPSHRMLGYDPELRKQEERDRDERQRRYLQEQQYEKAMQDIRDREDRLLSRIAAEEVRLQRRRQEIEDNAIKLHDGRRAYVDGHIFRDEAGRELQGADHDEAAEQRRQNPQASTWNQWSDVQNRIAEQARIRQEIETRRAQRTSGQSLTEAERRDQIREETNAAAHYEREQDSIEKHAAEIGERGAGQYTVDYANTRGSIKTDGALKTEFAEAAPGAGRPDNRSPNGTVVIAGTSPKRAGPDPV